MNEHDRPGPAEATLAEGVAAIARKTRGELGWSQRELGSRAGLSRARVARLELGHGGRGRIDDAARLLDTMGVRVHLLVRQPVLVGRPVQTDAAHARVVTYAARYLERAGWTMSREVPIGGDRIRGWIDLLAHDTSRGVLAVVECKGDLDDLGALERQVAWYEREAPWAAGRLGWGRSRARIVLVVALASRRNVDFVRANREPLRARFPDPVPRLLESLDRVGKTNGDLHVLAFVDPARRGPGWLIRSPLEPGRPVVPYDDARAFLAGRRRR